MLVKSEELCTRENAELVEKMMMMMQTVVQDENVGQGPLTGGENRGDNNKGKGKGGTRRKKVTFC